LLSNLRAENSRTAKGSSRCRATPTDLSTRLEQKYSQECIPIIECNSLANSASQSTGRHFQSTIDYSLSRTDRRTDGRMDSDGNDGGSIAGSKGRQEIAASQQEVPGRIEVQILVYGLYCRNGSVKDKKQLDKTGRTADWSDGRTVSIDWSD